MTQTHSIDATRVAEAVSDVSIVCRDLSHAWTPHGASVIDGGFLRTLRCRVCRTLRDEVLTSTGTVVARAYRYPQGYVIKGMGRITGEVKDALRLQAVLGSLELREDSQLLA